MIYIYICIDFAENLQTDVFELGGVFLKFCKVLLLCCYCVANVLLMCLNWAVSSSNFARCCYCVAIVLLMCC